MADMDTDGAIISGLRMPDSYDAKIAKICYLWTLCPEIQLKDHIFEIRQKAFLPKGSFARI